jgi:hypothetical protein
VANAPAAVSAIIMKLLAKTAEDRYQTAAGLEPIGLGPQQGKSAPHSAASYSAQEPSQWGTAHVSLLLPGDNELAMH